MSSRYRNPLVNIASMLICGLLAGVVVAAGVFPAVALSGMAAVVGGDAFGKLPDELIVKRSPQLSYLYAADGKTLLATMYDENRRDLPLADVPLIVRQAVLAAEDQKFYEHNGVDIKGIARAYIANKKAGDVQQGASTLTMQFVRLSISYSADTAQEVVDATEDTAKRKIREMRYAMAIEQRMSKDDILEGYLNTAYFGNRAYGIFAAAQVYFGKEPKTLTAAESAFLAALVKFPGDFDVISLKGQALAVARRDYVLDEMVGTGALTAQQGAVAKAEPLKVTGKFTPNGCVQSTNIKWGFFCDFFQRWWNQQPVFGVTPYDRERSLKSGGFRIITSLDVTAQSAMDRSIDRSVNKNPDLPGGKWKYKSDAVLLAAVEPGSGKVRGLAANRNFRIDSKTKPQNGKASNPALARRGVRGSYPNTTNPLLTGGPDIGGYQPGSVMKIFTMVAALEKGYPLSTVINTRAPYVSRTRITGSPNCGGYWCPTNSGGRNFGPQNMWNGFGSSINTFFVPLFEMTGGSHVIDTAKRMGLTFYDNPRSTLDDFYYSTQAADGWGPFTLGASDHTPLQIANAFATLAADGVYCEPIPVESITTSKGEKLAVGDRRCKQNIPVDVARAAIDAARCPVGDRSLYGKCQGATARDSREIIGKHIAGKTGTTDNSKSVTLTITTKQLAISGFQTDPDWAQVNHAMSHRVINPAVQFALRDAMKGKESIQFQRPSNLRLVTGSQVAIPAVKCRTVPQARSILNGKGFKVEVASKQVDSDCPKGTASGTNPSGRTIKNGIVVIEVSNGSKAKPSAPPQAPTSPQPSPPPGPGPNPPPPAVVAARYG
ncbi:transglycosylase domain-containing protein [Catellatospora coxensis]|uniref:Penicillin-binding protein n=1 Tax=Catellatospora coxensis TaxID=310354 RepID=A0A8J3PBK9_9ACTN|nr:transglycosylase domain-containing protein [Catellatospora coxensis]GIG09041.1 penicillin-binding protein [Catellatospora coxensis]